MQESCYVRGSAAHVDVAPGGPVCPVCRGPQLGLRPWAHSTLVEVKRFTQLLQTSGFSFAERNVFKKSKTNNKECPRTGCFR